MNKGNLNIRNKRASFDYNLEDKVVAGLQLTGSEIKSLRAGKASLNEAYCYFRKGEIWVKNMHIAEYHEASYNGHEPTRERKLLLKKKELKKLLGKTKEKGVTIVPLKLFINDRGWAKLEIGLGRGKKSFDKRESLKAKDSKRQLDRMMKQYK